jgi:hypothetical protein
LEELVLKNQDGDLGEKEKHDLQQFMLFEHLMRLAKAGSR